MLFFFFFPWNNKNSQKELKRKENSFNWVKARKKPLNSDQAEINSSFATWQPSIPLATRNFRYQEDILNTVHYGLFLTSYTHAFFHMDILWQEMKNWKKWQVRFKKASVTWLKEISSCIFWFLILTEQKAFFFFHL